MKLGPFIRNILNDSEGRLRTGWRLLVFGALALIIQTVLVFLIALFVDPRALLQSSISDADPFTLLSHAIGILVSTAAVYAARRWLDHRTFGSLGLKSRRWLVELSAGTAMAIGLQTLIFVVELAMGWLVIEEVGWRGVGPPMVGLVVMLLVFLAVAWNEELVTRGYLLQNLRTGLGTTLAVIISSGIFGALHIFNDNASIIAVLGITVSGVFFAIAYLVTRALWLPIGLHLGWNFAEGPLFGFPVSGLDAGGLITHRAVGPEAITGGAFGPEAGLLSVIADLIGIGVLLLWHRRNTKNRATTIQSEVAETE